MLPVSCLYRPRSCPPDVNCTTPDISFEVAAKPWHWPDSVWCTGSTEVTPIHFDYEVICTDNDGTQTDSRPAPFTCVAP